MLRDADEFVHLAGALPIPGCGEGRHGAQSLLDIFMFLKGWVTNHIMGADKGYTGFFHPVGVR